MALCQKITDIYIFFMLSVFPLFTGFQGYANITNSKFYCFAAVTLVWLTALLVCAIVRRIPAKDLPLTDPISICAYVFIALSCLSALCSPYPEKTLLGAGRWDGLVVWLLYLAVFLGIRFFGRLRAVHLYGLGVSLLLCACIASLQLLGRNPLALFPGNLNYFDAHVRYSGEFLGTIGNVDLLAGYLCLCIPLLAAEYIVRGNRPILLLPSAAGCFLLIVAGVDGGLLAVLVCALMSIPVLLRSRERLMRAAYTCSAALFAVFWALVLDFNSNGIRLTPDTAAYLVLSACLLCLSFAVTLQCCKPRRLIAAATLSKVFLILIAFALLSAVVLLYFHPGNSGTLYELSRILHGEIQDSFGSSRIRIWRETLALVPERPLLGGGPGTVAARLQIEFSRYVHETGKTLRSFVDNAHNMYLTILADIGILGLLSYLCLMLMNFLQWLKHKDEPNCMLPLGCGIICYWVQDFFGLGLCLIAPMFWVLWGLLAAKTPQLQDAREESLIQEESE